SDVCSSDLQALDFSYGMFNKKEMSRMWDYALRVEGAMAARPPNREVCSGGVNIGLAYIEGAPQEVIPKPIEPDFIREDNWQEERNTIRAELRQYWEKRYVMNR